MNYTSASEAASEASDRGISAGIRDRADPRVVLADRVDQLYSQMWLGILATFAIGAIATFEFWDERLRRRGHAVQLLPENPEFEPIEVDLRRDAMTIEGIAVGVIRNGKGL